ncbi:uncharacterized protein LY79DRAFT_197755 [Colletotrichum navitas]|uniref:Uncharacterized protein n=1 Tax=Colletotrichum navitas TaxID=681940 RepID=A0AAD8PZR9_9PEZI|nr:uncharacterized protein LY79DRAFT_197755 [Colletotrichum navitas]KAK1590707.1 hypothetical protein LY79DRAFT_197755 [Colletotrichum navitas]
METRSRTLQNSKTIPPSHQIRAECPAFRRPLLLSLVTDFDVKMRGEARRGGRRWGERRGREKKRQRGKGTKEIASPELELRRLSREGRVSVSIIRISPKLLSSYTNHHQKKKRSTSLEARRIRPDPDSAIARRHPARSYYNSSARPSLWPGSGNLLSH